MNPLLVEVTVIPPPTEAVIKATREFMVSEPITVATVIANPVPFPVVLNAYGEGPVAGIAVRISPGAYPLEDNRMYCDNVFPEMFET
jgi:hypothetical protein